MNVVIATGTGRYADPWHPFEATSRAVASILSAPGVDIHINNDLDDTLHHLTGVDLLIVNAGDPWRHGGTPAAVPPAAAAGLDAAITSGIGILSLHASVSSLRDYPAWAPAVGAIWVPTVSMHPPAGPARIHVLEHALTQGITDFDVVDERYCFLQTLGTRTTIAEHHHAGASFPTVWTRQDNQSRIACSLLGHDERSYESPGHRELLRRLATWAATRPGAQAGAPSPTHTGAAATTRDSIHHGGGVFPVS